MKKWFVIVLVFLLTGCTENQFEEKVNQLKQDIANEMGSTANFGVEEEFIFKQYGVNDSQPHNKIVAINNIIEYDKNVIYTHNNMTYETNYLGEERRGSYSFDSYKDLINNQGYIRPENEWYAVELTKMYKLGMGSFDPVSVVNAILYNNETIVFQGEEQITVEPEFYRIAVAELSSDVFEELFGSTIFRFINVELDYTVKATMKFNAQNQVEYIDFDIREMVGQIEDYNKYTLSSEINSIYGDYSLVFDSYDEVTITSVPVYVDWILDDTYEIEYVENLPHLSIGTTKAEVVYSDENEKFETTVSFETTENIDYLYYEIYYYRNDELLNTFYAEYYDLYEFENVVLHIYTSELDVDEVKFITRYIPSSSSTVYYESAIAETTIAGPIHSVDIDRTKYVDSATDLIPSVLVAPVGIVGGEDSFKITIDLHAVEESRDAYLTVYLLENGILKDVLKKEKFNIQQFNDEKMELITNFKPDEVLIDLSYKTSYFWLNEQKIHLNIHNIENPMDIIEDDGGVSVTAFEIDDTKWFSKKYLLSFNLNNNAEVFDAYVYFIDEDGIVIGWEHIVDFDIDDNYEVVSDLYEEDIEMIYIEISVDGVMYNVVAENGILVT